MLRYLLFISSLLLTAACHNTLPENLTDIIALPEYTPAARYERSDLSKMTWLAGVWKGEEAGRAVRQSFQFHNNQTLEIIRMEGNGDMMSLLLTWHNGRFYYGQHRQWVVTWIGEKDIRLDPTAPGLEPMTWTRLHADQWHLVRHTPSGDETTIMERTGEMNP
ncbi:MAG: hypothetical protein KIS77_12325 [Saprospiraceae bacterium]|nr:hypothetical protein [Saprospiraceae bacterium]